jgi:hypothetical protein
MSLPPSTEFRISEKLYLNFGRFTARRSAIRCLSPALIILVAIGIVLYLRDGDVIQAAMPVVAGFVAGGGYWLFSYLILLPPRLRRNYRESASLKEAMTFTPNETGFECIQASGAWHPKWEDMRKWEEASQFLAIFPSRVGACILPRDQVDETVLDYVRNRLIASGLRKPGKFRK